MGNSSRRDSNKRRPAQGFGGTFVPSQFYLAQPQYTPSRIIRQQALERYQELAQFRREQSELRQEFIRLIGLGARVEPGSLTVNLTTSERQYLSFAKLANVVGNRQAEAIMNKIPSTAVSTLRVGDRR